ncbi:MAG: Holliday junction branch migration protein RuvA [Chloroflexi bacterium]|nr:Holliday junction branch migration protein RuvA [Chloroflexota bacterium]
MIASVQGIVEFIGPDHLVVNVGGVGLQVFTSSATLQSIGGTGRRARLVTHLHVTEDALSLYGFAADEELRLFKLLTGVSGIGPKTALKMLSSLAASDLVTAIVNADEGTLTRIPGVGKKTAARICLELKATLAKEWSLTPGVKGPVMDDDALDALTSLGYSLAEARNALAAVQQGKKKMTVEEKVQRALQQLGR